MTRYDDSSKGLIEPPPSGRLGCWPLGSVHNNSSVMPSPPPHDAREPGVHHHVHCAVLHRAPPPVLQGLSARSRLRGGRSGSLQLVRVVGKEYCQPSSAAGVPGAGAHHLPVRDDKAAEPIAGLAWLQPECPRLEIPAMAGADGSHARRDALGEPARHQKLRGGSSRGSATHATFGSETCCPVSMSMSTFASDLRGRPLLRQATGSALSLLLFLVDFSACATPLRAAEIAAFCGGAHPLSGRLTTTRSAAPSAARALGAGRTVSDPNARFIAHRPSSGPSSTLHPAAPPPPPPPAAAAAALPESSPRASASPGDAARPAPSAARSPSSGRKRTRPS